MASKCITCFNPVVGIVSCVQLNGTYSGECCGRVGVQRSMCGVFEASVVQIVCMLTMQAILGSVESAGQCPLQDGSPDT